MAFSATLSLAACGQPDPAPEPEAKTEQTTSEPVYSVTLKPTLGSDGEVDAIDVSATLDGALAEGEDRLKLMVPVIYVMVSGIAERTLDLQVSDQSGNVPLSFEDGEPVPGGFPYYRTFTAEREISFPVSISYRSLVQPPNTPGGPAFGIRPSAGGVSGSGAGFMLYPSNSNATRSKLSWDLSAFEAEEAVGVTTYGAGEVEVDLSPSRLAQAWLMAGPAERYPDAGADSRFNSYWLGDFPYVVRDEMIFVEHMYRYLGDFFTHLDPPPRYTVFLRQLDTPPYGGATALYNSFMLSRGPAREEEIGMAGPRQTFVHEMLHQWVGFMEEEHGSMTWFTEGLTTYYEYTLPFRAGEISFDDFVDGLNKLSVRYFANPGRDMSAEAIVKVGFNDEHIRHVPYVRGAFYFADLDARIRAASNGERSFDDLMARIFRERESGALSLTIESFAEEASKETGADELDRLRAINLDGQFFYPSRNAFGPCVSGETAELSNEGEAYQGMVWSPAEGVPSDACYPQRAAD